MHHLAANDEQILPQGAHRNFMDGVSFQVSDPVTRLRMMAASCFFREPTYYGEASAREDLSRSEFFDSRLQETLGEVEDAAVRALPRGAALERTIDEALAVDAEATLKVAAVLRNEDLIRVTPQVIMVRAAHHPAVRGTGLVRKYAPEIISRGDEPALQLAYHNATYVRENGKPAPIPNALKKAWADYLSQASAYTLGKYRKLDGDSKTVDVVNVCRPKSDAVGLLVKGELKPQGRTWESLISAKGASEETWREAYGKFLRHPEGHMALLRNLRNLEKFKLLDEGVLESLRNGAAQGKQLPFRYHSAYQAMKGVGARQDVLDAIEHCLHASLNTLPRLPGRVMSLADNSGSAHGAFTSDNGKVTVSTIANLTAVLTGFMAGEEGWVGVFGDELRRYQVDTARSAIAQQDEVQALAGGVGQGTENGIWLFFREAMERKEHWDHIFIYSDEQAGYGGLYGCNPREYHEYGWDEPGDRYIDVPSLIKAYREQVNPNVMVYLVQMAGYSDSLVPEHYDKTVLLGGWSGSILRYASRMYEVMGSQGSTSR